MKFLDLARKRVLEDLQQPGIFGLGGAAIRLREDLEKPENEASRETAIMGYCRRATSDLYRRLRHMENGSMFQRELWTAPAFLTLGKGAHKSIFAATYEDLDRHIAYKESLAYADLERVNADKRFRAASTAAGFGKSDLVIDGVRALCEQVTADANEAEPESETL